MLGLGPQEYRATIASGWRAGRAAPRELGNRDDFAPPPTVNTDREFSDAILLYYRRMRGHTQSKLRAAWELAVLTETYLSRSVNAFTLLRETVEELRRVHRIGWRPATIRAYRVFAKYEWEELAPCGSVRAALEFHRKKNRTPEQEKKLGERKKRRAMTWDKYQRMEARLKQQDRAIEKMQETIRWLQDGRGPCPNCGCES